MTLTEKLNKWLKDNDFDVSVVEDTEFYVDLTLNEIHFAVTPTPLDNEFRKFCCEMFPQMENVDIFTLSFFHELGHIMTENEWTDNEWKKYEKFTDKDFDFANYFCNPIEYRATEWGCEYIAENIDVIRVFGV